MKRLIDFTFSTLMLIPLSVVIAGLALLVWLEDRHWPFFSHLRYGRNGSKFNLYKFRTMKPEDHVIEDYRDDNRRTRIGRILWRLHLDELPQVFNVWLGDMSFIGPRPIPVGLPVAHYKNWQLRSTVRPGMSGMAQIYCTKYTTLVSKFHFDALYVNRQSLWLDFKLVLATFRKLKATLILPLWTLFVFVILLIPYPETSYPVIGGIQDIDKVGHYVLWIVSTCIALWSVSKHRYIVAIAYGVVLALSTELLQGLVPARTASLGDLFYDALGIVVGGLFYVVLISEWGEN